MYSLGQPQGRSPLFILGPGLWFSKPWVSQVPFLKTLFFQKKYPFVGFIFMITSSIIYLGKIPVSLCHQINKKLTRQTATGNPACRGGISVAPFTAVFVEHGDTPCREAEARALVLALNCFNRRATTMRKNGYTCREIEQWRKFPKFGRFCFVLFFENSK